MPKDIDKGIDSLPKCDKYTYNGSSTLSIKFVCGHCFYGLRCWFKYVPGRELPYEYTIELTTFIKPAIEKWFQKVPPKHQKGDPRKNTKIMKECRPIPNARKY